MRSSVPCSSRIDSFSLLDVQVVSLKRDYYDSLVCQVDFVRDNPSRKTPLFSTVGLTKYNYCLYYYIVTKAFLYLRTSGDDRQDKAGIPVQRESCMAFAD